MTATGEPSRWSRLKHWANPPSSPAPLQFDCTSDELLEMWGSLDEARATEVLGVAEFAFRDVAEHADGADRRAGTIQSAIAIATSLSVAGASLLLDSSNVADATWRAVLAALLLLLVVSFATATWRAMLVTRARWGWASPDFEEISEYTCKSAAEIQARRAADLFVAYGRNDSVTVEKTILLASAGRWLLGALAQLAVLVALLAAYIVFCT